MPRQYQTFDINNFVKGLITEVSPLTFPEGASLAEDNFVLNRDGTRNRRLGMSELPTTTPSDSQFSDKSSLTNVFEWDFPGGFTDKKFLVMQDRDVVRVFDLSVSPFIQIHTWTLPRPGLDTRFSFTAVDGILVVSTGNSSIYTLDYDGSFQRSSKNLLIRDVFGVDDGLTVGMDVTIRPTHLDYKHIYNLRNQSWAVARVEENYESLRDPIQSIFSPLRGRWDFVGGWYPSNADTVNQALYADPNDSDGRTKVRFFPEDLFTNPIGTLPASKGYFIIDALSRGASRLSEVQKLNANDNTLRYPVPSLPLDFTPGGASVVQEFSGRVFYAGFSSELRDGDDKSPRMGSYLLFSKLVQNPEDINLCYSEADPTSPDDYEQVVTDGGFLRIDEANNIVGLRVLRDSLYVLAENGIWSVKGGTTGFNSQDVTVSKVTDKGVLSTSSVITTDQSLIYWSPSGIFSIGPNEFGDYIPQNISNTTIQRVYNDIPYVSKISASGVYDSYEQKIRWVHSTNRELILDLNLNAFYTNTFNDGREVRSAFQVPPFTTLSVTENVTVQGEVVTVNGVDVTVSFTGRQSRLREVAYVVARERGNDLTDMSFATISDGTYKDWGLLDAPAYLITGYSTGGDFQRKKGVPYLTLHFRRTETNLDGAYNLVGESSCMVRSSWDWANSINSNRWGRPFQGYRYRKAYIPSGPGVGFDNGFETVVTKNKLRGSGKALSLHFNTEPGKDCHILGWSYISGIAGNV